MTQNLVSLPSPETVTQSPLLEWVKRHTLVAFFILTFGYSWLVGLPIVASSLGLLSFHIARLPALLIQLVAALGTDVLCALAHRSDQRKSGPARPAQPTGALACRSAMVRLRALELGRNYPVKRVGVLLGWVYINTRGNLLLCVLFHAAGNTFVSSVLPVTPGTRPYMLMDALIWVVVVIAGPAHLSRQRQVEQRQ